MEFGEHKVETHARKTDLSVAYTIDPAVVKDYISIMEQLLARDKYKVAGDTSPTYLPFQTLLPLFWTLTCMI